MYSAKDYQKMDIPDCNILGKEFCSLIAKAKGFDRSGDNLTPYHEHNMKQIEMVRVFDCQH